MRVVFAKLQPWPSQGLKVNGALRLAMPIHGTNVPVKPEKWQKSQWIRAMINARTGSTDRKYLPGTNVPCALAAIGLVIAYICCRICREKPMGLQSGHSG
jgi:hypothetical protein